MPAPLPQAVSTARYHNHGQRRGSIRNGTQQADTQDAGDTAVFNQGRQPEANGVKTGDQAEIDQG